MFCYAGTKIVQHEQICAEVLHIQTKEAVRDMNYIVINLICLLLSFSSIYPDMGEKAYTETVTGETTINGLKIEEHTITAYYRGEEELVKGRI